MADIPLNYFRRQVYTLTTSPSAVYIAPFDRAAILLAGYATNLSPSDVTVTIGVSGVGGTFVDPLPYYDYAKNHLISGNDTTSMFPNKFVLNQYDALIASCNTPGAVVFNISLLETVNTLA